MNDPHISQSAPVSAPEAGTAPVEKAAAANAAGLSSPFAAAISYWTGPRMANGDPLDSPDNTSPNGWGEYEPTTLAHGKAIAERGDTDKRVKWLYDHRTPAEKAGDLDAEQVRFEKWASGPAHTTLSHVFSFTRNANRTRYLEGTTELCWRAWQAALERRAPAADRAALKDGEA